MESQKAVRESKTRLALLVQEHLPVGITANRVLYHAVVPWRNQDHVFRAKDLHEEISN